ncbi:MAG: PhnD/SsuA/transferrin family substrate-binding protein [Deltaproteobacteria bacterium]|nr:PhnD/SsuA/transferrin family substrate-binding protein [Candidatus Anaeroferrophillus wilburensis]MBN2889258.1 PhnD/SsuA/transferrin family substrate-binding protein [Deltaproteobacteria bacterium]
MVIIGVLASRGDIQCLNRWQATAGYLTHNNGEQLDFVVFPVGFADMEEVVAQGLVDFLLTNPCSYTTLEQQQGISCIATLVNRNSYGDFPTFAGVVFTRKERDDISRLADLRQKKVMAVAPDSFGGWIVAWREMQAVGVDPYRDLAQLSFGGTHDAVVYAVEQGRVDAGVVRADTLERMSVEGRISFGDYKVLHEDPPVKADIPFIHTTRSYPEWPLAKLKHTPEKLAKLVTVLLLQMKDTDPAAVAGSYAGWTVPLPYEDVDDCLHELGLCVAPHQMTIREIFVKYWYVAAGVLSVVIFLSVLILVIIRYNRKVARKKSRLEEALNRLEQADADRHERINFLQELLNAVPNPIFYKDREGRYLGCNRAFAEFAGLPAGRIIGRTAAEVVDRHLAQKAQETDQALLHDDAVKQVYETEATSADGRHHFFVINKTSFVRQDGSLGGLIGSMYDLTAQKETKNRLDQLASVVEQASEVVVITDLDGQIEYVNPAFTTVTGYSREEALGQNPPILKSDRQDEAFYRRLWETLNSGGVWYGTFHNLRKNGELFQERAAIFPIKDKEQRISKYAAVKRDITKESLLEDQLRLSQRLEAVGQLAAGVAHELNTPIGFVASNSESIKQYVGKFTSLIAAYRAFVTHVGAGDGSLYADQLNSLRKLEEENHLEFILGDLEELFAESAEGFARVTEIITKLREFSRIDHCDKQGDYQLNEAVKTTLVVAKNEYKYVAEVELDLAPVLPMVECNSGEINQVLLNIIVNAAQALKEQERDGMGTITIATGCDDRWLTCRISDNGPGIMPEHLKKIFNPFFTTKPVGSGTGIGLYISYDIIVNKHHGELLVDSMPGRGTTFTIRLPRQLKETPPSDATPAIHVDDGQSCDHSLPVTVVGSLESY